MTALHRTLAGIALVLAFVVTSHPDAQQVPQRDQPATALLPPGTAVISGRVLSDANPGEPIRRVTVTVAELATGLGRQTVTEETGRFEFANLRAGQYRLTAVKAAYLPGGFGVTKPSRAGNVPNNTIISLGDSERMTDIVLRLWRGAVITGTVRDGSGRPVRGAGISVQMLLRTGPVGLASSGARTDGSGSYRLYGLAPGSYRVLAQPPGGAGVELESTTEADVRRVAELSRAGGPGAAISPAPVAAQRRPTVVYRPMYYPNATTISDATPVTVAAGEERSGVDIQLRSNPAARIDGVVTGMDGKPVSGLSVAAFGEWGNTVAWGTADAEGKFSIRPVPPGSYTVEAVPAASRGIAEGAWARANVQVQSGVDVAVQLTLTPGLRLAGTVVIEPGSATPPPDLRRAQIYFRSDIRYPWSATIAADGTITFGPITPAKYQVSAAGPTPAPWVAKSVTLNGRDLLDGLVDIGPSDDGGVITVTLTDHPSEITGSITDAAGRPTPDYFIIAFPADRALWTFQSHRISQTRPSTDGKFTFRNLPAGDYCIGAVTEAEQLQWFEPAFLEPLLGASVRLTLADGQKIVQNIRLK